MDSSYYSCHTDRDAKIIEALNVALHTLVIHDGMLVRTEGDEWALNFRSEIERVRQAMEMLGINTSGQLIGPPWEHHDDEKDDGDA